MTGKRSFLGACGEQKRMKTRRMNDEERAAEQERNAEAMRVRRMNEEERAAEQERNAEAMRVRRMNDQERAAEQARNTEYRRTHRENEDVRGAEQARDTEYRRTHRENEDVRAAEQARNTEYRRQHRDMSKMEWDRLIQIYEAEIEERADHVCVCCGGLFYQVNVTNLSEVSIASKFGHSFLSSCSLAKVCHTCWKSIKTGKMPKLCLSNGLQFPDVPFILKVII